MPKPPRIPHLIILCCLFSLAAPPSQAASFRPDGAFIGETGQYRIQENESLLEIARRYDLGFNAITAANPGVDPFLPEPGTLVTIPGARIVPSLPNGPAIVINLPEFRLYYFPAPPHGRVVTFPLGIGDEGVATPQGSYTVVDKIVGPAWNVPESIREKEPDLPKVVPPGPGNPMGTHALRLSRGDILIHGTNRPWGIGRRSSHGCLRLYPEDIVELFSLVRVGTAVVIMNRPVKVGGKGNRVFVEVHSDDGTEPTVAEALSLLADRNLLRLADFSKLARAVEERRGVPVDVTREP